MTDHLFDELRRQREELERLVEPYRRQHDEILRSLAPMRETQEQVLKAIDSYAATLGYKDAVRALGAIGGLDLADFSGIAALTKPDQGLREIQEAVNDQTRWITEALALSPRIPEQIEAAARSFAALEKLSASRDVLLDERHWLEPRPFSSAVTDILYAGRGEWALTWPRPVENVAPRGRLAEVSGSVIGELVSIEDDSEVLIQIEDARREVASVAHVLFERTPLVSPFGVLLFVQPERSKAFKNVKTIAAVIRYLETRSVKPLYGGFGGWLMEAGLDIVDPSRSAKNRFDSAVTHFHDAFVDGPRNADAALADKAPAFFQKTIKGLRDTSAAHAPEAAVKFSRIVPNLLERERLLRELVGKVPASETEWLDALSALLEKTAAAATEFRDTLSR